MKNTTILFDLDGTLINSMEAINESFAYSFSCMGKKECDYQLLHTLIGYTLEDIFLKLGIKTENIQIAIDFYKVKYREISNEKTVLLDNARESIKLAHSFATLGIVTTKTSTYSIELLKHLDIYHYFDTIIGFNDVINPKPHPEPIEKAMKILKSDKDTTWMIGDTTFDTKCAFNANIKSIGLLCGHGVEKDMREHTKFICKNTQEAVQLIQNFKY
jgi:phosphoglycolate phosphatase